MAESHKQHVYFTSQSLERIKALKEHYQNLHGLPLTTGAVLRRALDELANSLQLQGQLRTPS